MYARGRTRTTDGGPPLRSRHVVWIALLVALGAVAAPATAAFAQEGVVGEEQDAGSEQGGGGGGEQEGQGDVETESGVEEGEGEEAAEEEGPQWTYQMARITLALMLFVLVGIGLLYWRLVAQRQKRAA